MADFNIAYSITKKHEGGYANKPNDRGGETYKGIARKFHPKWKGWDIVDSYKIRVDFPLCLGKDSRLKTLVHSFYKVKFWDVFEGDKLPQEIANELFDTGVNQGIGTAITFFQISLNALNRNGTLYKDLLVDGQYGSKTSGAVKAYFENDTMELLYKCLNILQGARYIDIMSKDPTQEDFARGWLERVDFIK